MQSQRPSAVDRAPGLGTWLQRIAPALLLALPALPWLCPAVASASWTTLGRDQGIFQYVAWAVGQGDVLYRDIRDVNGPVISLVHVVFLALGGAEEHRFRLLDLSATSLSFLAAGALLPSIARAPVTISTRIVWALAAWVALMAQYVVYGFWDMAQRESFLDWFVLVSVALQATRASSGEPRTRTTRAVLVLAGLFSFVSWLGKPPYAIFTLAQLFTLAAEPFALRDRARRLLLFVVGGACGVAMPILYVALRGDVRAWLQITLVDVPAMYRFIWPRTPSSILSLAGYAALARTAALTTFALAVLMVLRRLPWRALPAALFPLLGLACVLAQSKGFPYHFHPVTLGITFGWLVVLATMSQALPVTTERRAGIVGQRVVLACAGLLFGVRSGYYAWLFPDPPPPPADARTPADLESEERLYAFERIDFFPRAMREAAAYVAARTAPTDRVQIYSMDAYLLFLARRKSATPYIYAYDLNTDAALHGSFDPDGPKPTAEQRERVLAIQAEHARDLHARVTASPPAAFVFGDRSPLLSHENAFYDFTVHCPQTAAWLREHYRETAELGELHVWLRNDLAP